MRSISKWFKRKEYAGVAELADAPDLGSGVHDVQVQVLLSAVSKRKGMA